MYKFWQWDILWLKRIKQLEQRIRALEDEVSPPKTFAAELWSSLWSQPNPLRLHQKVALLAQHLRIEFRSTPQKFVIRKVK